MSSNNLVSKHLLRRDIERDPDHINQMLWKRKLYKKRVQRNEQKKVRKQFFKTKEGEASEGGDVALVNEGTVVDDKKKEFYKQLFAKKEGEEEVKPKKKKNKKKIGVKESEGKEEEVKEEKEQEESEEEGVKEVKENKNKKG